MKDKNEFEVLGLFLLVAITVILMAYIGAI
jgi:FlaG/FlaF family flagellin (archaellin)